MSQFNFWLLTSIFGLGVIIIGFLGKLMITQVLTRLEQILVELKNLNSTTDKHDTKIEMLQIQQISNANILNDHSNRIGHLEYVSNIKN